MDIKGKTIIVTGGASGLGAACAERFTKAGAQVVVADLKEPSTKVKFFKTDVTSEASVQAVVDGAWDEFGSLDGLINCAGIVVPEKVVNKEGQPHGLQSFKRTIEINLIGTFNMIRLVAASIAAKKAGVSGEKAVIVNTSSIAAFEGQIGQAAYSASKGAIASMTLPLAREFSPLGIRVMTISPGVFETPMMAGFSEKVIASLSQQIPFPSRLGKPDEYAALAQHIFENQMLNGEVIRLDGAMRMGAR